MPNVIFPLGKSQREKLHNCELAWVLNRLPPKMRKIILDIEAWFVTS